MASYNKFQKYKEIKDIEVLEEFLSGAYAPDSYEEKYYNLKYQVMGDFPVGIIDGLLDDYYNDQKICYTKWIQIELVKYIYGIWKEKEHKLYPWVERIRGHLVETANLSQEELRDIMYNPKNPKYHKRNHHRYYTWWLYVFYPLLEDAETLMLKLIKIASLEDAQDMFLDGIYLMEPDRLYAFMKKLLPALYEKNYMDMCFDPLCSSTRALYQLKRITGKLNDAGLKLFEEPYLINLHQKDVEYLNGVVDYDVTSLGE